LKNDVLLRGLYTDQPKSLTTKVKKVHQGSDHQGLVTKRLIKNSSVNSLSSAFSAVKSFFFT